MNFALHFANLVCPGPDEAVRLARAAESAGFESLLTVEHVVWPTHYDSVYPYSPSGRLPGGPDTPLPDPLIWMAHVAACTTTLRFVTGVLVLPQRNPLIVAKQVATLDAMSGGRIELGVGVGWLREEFDALGVPFSERGSRTDEYLEAIRALWEGDDVGYTGRHVRFSGMSCNPKPVQRPLPIIVGGHAPAAARRAGRLGDGFFPATGAAGDLIPLFDEVRRAADAAGRDPQALRFMAGCPDALGEEPFPALEQLATAGVSRVVLPAHAFAADPDELLGRFGERVIAALR